MSYRGSQSQVSQSQIDLREQSQQSARCSQDLLTFSYHNLHESSLNPKREKTPSIYKIFASSRNDLCRKLHRSSPIRRSFGQTKGTIVLDQTPRTEPSKETWYLRQNRRGATRVSSRQEIEILPPKKKRSKKKEKRSLEREKRRVHGAFFAWDQEPERPIRLLIETIRWGPAIGGARALACSS